MAGDRELQADGQPGIGQAREPRGRRDTLGGDDAGEAEAGTREEQSLVRGELPAILPLLSKIQGLSMNVLP